MRSTTLLSAPIQISDVLERVGTRSEALERAGMRPTALERVATRSKALETDSNAAAACAPNPRDCPKR